MTRIWPILLNGIAVCALLGLFAPTLWVMLARDDDPRGKIAGYFFVYHKDRHQLFIRTPSGSEHTVNTRSTGSICIAVLAVWAGVAFARYAAKLRLNQLTEQREKRGLCPSCGYDIRATPDRCPECGATMTAEPPPVSDPPAAE